MGAVNLCRLCAVNKDNFLGIYDDEGHKLSLETKITKCLQIELYPKDPLPKTVCLDCCAKLNQCSDFFEITSQAQVTLHMIFLGTKKEEELHVQEHRPECVQEPDHDSSSFLEEEKSVDPGPPVLVECVLSDTQGAGGEQKGDASGESESLPVLSSRRKRRVPVRCAQQHQQQQEQLQQDQQEQHIREKQRPRPGRPPASRKTRRGRSKTAEPDSKQEQQLKQEQQQTEEQEVKPDLEELEDQQGEQHVQEQEEDKEQEHQQDDLSSARKRRDGWEKYPWMCTDCSQVMLLHCITNLP